MLCPCCGSDIEPGTPACNCGARFVGEPFDEAPVKVQRLGLPMLAVALLALVVTASLVFTKYLAFAGVLVIWSARRAMNLARHEPDWYGGYRTAAATLVLTLVAGAVAGGYGIAYIPDYLENRRMRQEAATRATLLNVGRMAEEYKRKYGAYPPDELEIKKTTGEPLPTDYWENAIKYQSERDELAGKSPGVTEVRAKSFELRSAGPDEKMGTDDDIIMRDGIFLTAAEAKLRSPMQGTAAK